MKDEKNEFEFRYRAPTVDERREIESIRRQYLPAEEVKSGMEELRRLNDKVKTLPIVLSLILGIAGILVFGLGLCFVLEWDLLVWGIVTGAIGLAVAATAYPVYRAVLRYKKKKYGGEILRLTGELLGRNETEREE